MVRLPASGRPCTRRFRSAKPSPRPTANSGAASGPTAAGGACLHPRPRPEAPERLVVHDFGSVRGRAGRGSPEENGAPFCLVDTGRRIPERSVEAAALEAQLVAPGLVHLRN